MQGSPNEPTKGFGQDQNYDELTNAPNQRRTVTSSLPDIASASPVQYSEGKGIGEANVPDDLMKQTTVHGRTWESSMAIDRQTITHAQVAPQNKIGDMLKQNMETEIIKVHDINNYDKVRSSKEYLKDVLRYAIDLTTLYKVVDSCDSEPGYGPVNGPTICPVLLKATHLGPNVYLLQIWTDSQLLFEKNLAAPPTNWGTFGNTFVWQEKGQPRTIYKLECFIDKQSPLQKYNLPSPVSNDPHWLPEYTADETRVSRSEKAIRRMIGYQNGQIFIATHQALFYFPAEDSVDDAFDTSFEVASESLKKVNMARGRTVRSLIQTAENEVVLLLENTEEDDPNRMGSKFHPGTVSFLKVDKSNGQQLNLLELNFRRKDLKAIDKAPIVDVRAVHVHQDDGLHVYTTVLRGDGALEIYLDYNIASEMKALENMHFTGCEVDFTKVYFAVSKRTKTGETANRVYQCPYTWRDRVNFSNSKKMKDEGQFEIITHRRVCKHMRLYSSFVNFSNFFLVAHRNRVSVKDLTKKGDTLKTLPAYQHQIVHLAIHRRAPREGDDDAYSKKYEVAVTLANDTVHFIELTENGMEKSDALDVKFPGLEVKEVIADTETNQALFYLLARKARKVASKVQDDTQIFWLKFRETKESMLLYSLRKGIKTQLFPNESVGELDPDTTVTVLISKGVMSQDYDASGVKLIVNLAISGPTKTQTYRFFETMQRNQPVHRIEQNEYLGDLVHHETDHHRTLEIAILTGDNYNEDCQRHALRITSGGLYLYTSTGEFKCQFMDTFIRQVLYIDDCYLYCLTESGEVSAQCVTPTDTKPVVSDMRDVKSGLYVFDLSRLINGNKLEGYMLNRAVMGVNTDLDYSPFTERLSFIQNYDCIVMLPFLHRNTINFIGMGQKVGYLAWRESEGVFTALHKDGSIHSWCIASGKHIHKSALVGIDLTGYEIYKANYEDNSFLSDFYRQEERTLTLLKGPAVDRGMTISDSAVAVTQQLASQSTIGRHVVHQTSTELMKTAGFKSRGSFIQRPHISPVQEVEVQVQSIASRRTYHRFKLLQIQTFNESHDQVKELFSFEFGVKQNPQILQISQDTTKMMAIMDQRVANIYVRDEPKDGFIQWNLVQTVHQYPNMLTAGRITANFIFSPNFDFFIDCKYMKGHFCVTRTHDQQVVATISENLLSLNSKQGENKSMASVNELASRIYFMRDDMLRVVNKEGIDCLVTIDEAKGAIDIVSCAKIDNFAAENFSDRHYLLERTPIGVGECFERLLRKCNEHKVHIQHLKYLQKDYSRKNDLLAKLYTVDYSHPIYEKHEDGTYHNCVHSQFTADLSFTMLDWIILDRIVSHTDFNIGNIDREQQLQLCFNIFPGSQTIFHKLAKQSQAAKSKKGLDNTNGTVRTLFECAEGGLSYQGQGFEANQPFEVPIFEDQYGKTALDYALENVDKTESQIFKSGGVVIPETFWQKFNRILFGIENHQFSNVSLAAIIFDKIKDYSYLHSGQALPSTIVKAVLQEVPGIGDYMNARLVKSQHSLMINQKKMRPELVYTHIEEEVSQNYGMIQADIWADKKQIRREMFVEGGPDKRTLVRYFDVPLLHANSKMGAKFMRALDRTSDTQLFSKLAVQAIINRHWHRTKYVFWFTMMLPYVIQIATFTYWSNFVLGSSLRSDWFQTQNSWCTQILQITSGYFLGIEFNQMVSQRVWPYLKTPWNYIESSPLILIAWNCHRANQRDINEYFYRFQACAALLSWMKFLYYLRSFERTGYLVKMVAEVCYDMKEFLFLLVIAMIGFADAFYSISISISEYGDYQEPFITSITQALQYSYLLALGEFGLDSLDNSGWLMFILASVFNLVVMLNLLIAIISSTYERVMSSQIEYSFKERVSLYNDVQLITRYIKFFKGTEESRKLMLLAQEDGSNDVDCEREPEESVDKVDLLLERVSELADKLERQDRAHNYSEMI